SAMGQDPEILKEVCGWVNAVATRPVWAKMTPNITHIEDPARVCLHAGCEGLSAINTILCVMGVDLATLRPEPTVEGYTTPGGYSCKAIRPIALRMVMECARLIHNEFPAWVPPLSERGVLPSAAATPNQNNLSISGLGGIETGEDAAQFILLGANTVQVCTGVMIHGYGLVKELCRGLSAFMDRHGFKSIEDFRGHSLQYFTTHADLVARQATARTASGKSAGKPDGVVTKDTQWTGDKFVEQSSKLVSNG
ncbi:MAG: hypothetical protein H7210_09060, partial [Pyrinomonadaceae bacterium]|nr:hypothetical protein [Phycisphaerales bacterium]